MTDETYQEKKTLLEDCRTLAQTLFGSLDKAEHWLSEKSDSFWDLSPLECIREGKGNEVLSLLEARLKSIQG